MNPSRILPAYFVLAFAGIVFPAALAPVAVAHAACAPPSAVIWGSTGSGAGNFSNPWGVAIGPDGTVFVTDESNNRIQKFGADGAYVGEWSTGFDTNPVGIAIDPAGVVYVSLHHIHQIAKYTTSGALLGTFGSGDPGPAQIGYPVGIALGDNKVYVASSYFDKIQVFTPDGSYLGGWSVSFPYGVQVDAAQNVYVSSYSTWLVYKYLPTGGIPLQTIGSPGTGDGQFEYPVSMAFDAVGDLYVIDGDNARVQKFDGGGAFLCNWGSAGTGAGQLSHPTGIALGADGRIYVAEWGNDRIQLFADRPVPANATTWGRLKANYR
jgi:DNA-binding beta-propeller fold protein YncE